MRFQHRLSVSLIVRHGVTQLRYLGTLQQRNSFPRAAACASAIGAALPADVQGGGTILRLVDALTRQCGSTPAASCLVAGDKVCRRSRCLPLNPDVVCGSGQRGCRRFTSLGQLPCSGGCPLAATYRAGHRRTAAAPPKARSAGPRRRGGKKQSMMQRGRAAERPTT